MGLGCALRILVHGYGVWGVTSLYYNGSYSHLQGEDFSVILGRIWLVAVNSEIQMKNLFWESS